MQRRLTLRIARWLVAALVWAAVLPGAAAVVRMLGDGPPTWAMVCTSQGMQWVSLDPAATTDDDSRGTTEGSTGAMHCPWCRLHADMPSDLPRAPRLIPTCTLQAELPPAWAGTGPPAAPHLLLTAAPRAPPR